MEINQQYFRPFLPRLLNCSVCLFSSYKPNDIIDLHYCLICACVSSMKRQNESLGPHNVIRTKSPLLTSLFGRTYFSPLPRDLHKGKQQLQTLWCSQACGLLHLSKSSSHVEWWDNSLLILIAKIYWFQESCISTNTWICGIWYSSLAISMPVW